MKQEIREAAIKLIISRAKQGIDCTESESAEIKGYLRDNYGSELYKELAYLFPSEHCEILEEHESKEVSNVSDGENLREQAIIWWHDLAFDEREKYYDGYKKWTPAKDHTQLTGREIQNILAVVINPPEPKEEPVSDLSYPEKIKGINDLLDNQQKEREEKYLNQEPVSLSVEEAAEFILKKVKPSIKYDKDIIQGMVKLADWQKKQSEKLIKELLEALKSVKPLNLHLYDEGTVGNRVKLSVESAIIKAETYLSK